MATAKMEIVRKLAGKAATVYNDKLADGTRSIKVPGWTRNNYAEAAKQLQAAGFEPFVYTFRKFSPRGGCFYIQTRIHV